MATPIQTMAMATAVGITAVIGAKADALPGELIGDGIAGIRTVTLYAQAACPARFPFATA
jgi:hypothetical protein